MNVGRILYNRQVLTVTSTQPGVLHLPDGQILREGHDQWVYLPPIEARTIFALGLNYADHAKELSFQPPSQPLVFLKGTHTLVGHQQYTPRPADVTFMHYECELAVVIGKRGKNIPEADAYQYIAGYTVANDYALRDYLENYYRPNLRVKNRDATTPIGPFIVPKEAVPNPMNLALTTRVNGQITQKGSTADMVFSIPYLVSYLSSLMTLQVGDIILTGTPDGLADVHPGDVVETEIEGIGCLVNTIVSQQTFLEQEDAKN